MPSRFQPGTSSANRVDRALRLAYLLAMAGEEGLSVESLLVSVGGSRASLYRDLDLLRGAGWPVEAIYKEGWALYRLEGGQRLR